MTFGLLFAIALELLTASYRFDQTVAGYRPGHQEGRVTVDGARWRIDTSEPDFNTLTGEGDQPGIAINDSNHTWFPLKSRARLAIGGPLFTFWLSSTVSNLRVAFADSTKQRLSFSYDLESLVSGEKVRGRVWGEIRVWPRPEGANVLPWDPSAVATGSDEVDAALRAHLAPTSWKTVTEVSRKIENGETYRQTITRTISEPEPATPGRDAFKVPAGYRQQEPVIGAPGK